MAEIETTKNIQYFYKFSPSPNMYLENLIPKLKEIIFFGNTSSNLVETHVFLMSILRSTSYYTPKPYIGCPYPCPCSPMPNLNSMGGHMPCYTWAWMGMGGHMSCYGWAWVAADGCGLGMGTNSKEMLGATTHQANRCAIQRINGIRHQQVLPNPTSTNISPIWEYV